MTTNINTVTTLTGVVTQAARHVISPYAGLLTTQASIPAAIGNALADINNGQPSSVYLNNNGTISINCSIITLTARIEQMLLLGGLVAGAPVSAPLAIALGVLAVALSPEIREAISDPEFWDLLDDHRDELLRDIFDPFFDLLKNTGEWWGEHIYDWINPEVNQLFQFAQRPIDPLALDLDGDGVETIGTGDWQTTVLFDHDADGQRTGTGWVHADDGLLVRDRDGNGVIDSGRELFGDQTRLADGALAADAYAALADLDTHPDGRIDANDAAFTQLQVWQDRNQDGISQADELSTLAERGIQSISTQSQSHGGWSNGNLLAATGEYQRTDGTSGITGGLAFGTSNFFSAFQDSIAIGDQAAALPDMRGSGQVRDLRQAASLSSGLAGTLQAFSDASLRMVRRTRAAGLLVTPSRFSHCTPKQCESRFQPQGAGLFVGC